MAKLSTEEAMKMLSKLEGAVLEYTDPFETVARTKSPSVNYVFGRSQGLPYGYTAILYGRPKAGKSLLSRMFIGQMHQEDPTSIAVVFDTEMRFRAQVDPLAARAFGIDTKRVRLIESNRPKDIFDQISDKISSMCQAGANVRMIVIDSIKTIAGKREMNKKSVEDVTIGDLALTLGEGFKQILPIIRKYNIALLIVDQVRAEMDPTEIMRKNFVKMASSFAVQHFGEYFILVDENRTVEGRKDAFGNELTNEEVTDLAGNSDKVAKKIRVKMVNNTLGPSGRTGEFTLHLRDGLINTWEELVRLAIGYNLVERPNNRTYILAGKTFTSYDAFLQGVRDDIKLQNDLEAKIRQMDLDNRLGACLTDIQLDEDLPLE